MDQMLWCPIFATGAIADSIVKQSLKGYGHLEVLLPLQAPLLHYTHSSGL